MKTDIRFPRFDRAAVDAIKSLPKHARRWNPDARCWMVEAEHILTVATLVEKIFPTLAKELRTGDAYAEARKAAQGVEAARTASRATDAKVDIPAPEGLEYMPFQRAGIAYAMKREGALIGDEMGLGKTIQAIGVVNATPDARRILVVCPASLRLNWQRELQKWLVADLTVGVAQGKNWPETDVVVINYDILKRHKATLDAEVWDILIVDECHYLKNPKTQRTKAVLGAWNEDPRKVVKAIAAKRRLFLTGTPIVNRPIELWPLLRSLDPDNLGRYWKGYVKRYCAGYQDVVRTRHGTKTIWQVGGASNLEELQDRLRATLMVRRLKADVLTELPAKRRQVIEVPPNGSVRIVKAEQKAWREVQEQLEDLRAQVELAKASEDEEDYRAAVAALTEQERVAFNEMSRLRHETALAKVDYVVEHVLNATDKVVVFAHHRDVISALVTALREAERKVVTITGDTPMNARQAAVDAFQNDPETTVFVGNIQAAGVGLTLTAASHVVFAELDWVPGNMSQAEDRCHRIGQTQSVLVQHLVLDGTLDATMAHTLVEKQEVIDKALDTPTAMKPVTPIEPPATKSTKRDQLGAEAANFTDEMVAAVHKALQRLAGVCDGAYSLDDMGFNRIDTRIGHSLAACETLTKRQAALGRKIVRKYHRQIGEELIETMKTKKAKMKYPYIQRGNTMRFKAGKNVFDMPAPGCMHGGACKEPVAYTVFEKKGRRVSAQCLCETHTHEKATKLGIEMPTEQEK